MNLTDFIQFVIMILTAVALIVTVRNFKKQLQLNFFAEYTRRYQGIILNFPETINEKDFSFSDLSPKDRSHTLRYMRAYFDLCSEEFFLWQSKYIGEKTWREWKSGIVYAFSKPAFREAWAIVHKDTIYYDEFALFVKDCMKNIQKT